MLLFLSACVSEETKKPNNSDYIMPVNYEETTFVVEEIDGFELTTHEIPHYDENYDSFEEWQEYNARKEAQDKYDMVRDVFDNYKEVEEEEEELKYYCESLHSNSCLEMTWIKDHNGCREVQVECSKYDSDDICIRFDVDIKEERQPDNRC